MPKFIEVTRIGLDDDVEYGKILINTDRILNVYTSENGKTLLGVAGGSYVVKEEYEDIRGLLNWSQV